ncbi:AAA family ATPase [Acidianus sp. HS-5]|uniref:AAA family ATPase n=1 Tax=Acidianus sp. HS-5 TaxID=2886040 RepID=UPI001F16D8A2|nr:AAA family ATPase [Acidianus sp. HS-5]BDC18535.1 hypothetical protein HS5_14250 [Acidianus sp. HS-5]
MKLIARNLGPIRYANLDFNDKIIIIGPNSSGKTFLSTAFYILYGPINVLPFTPSSVNIKLEEGIINLELDLKDFENDLPQYFKRVIELTFSDPKNLVTFGEEKCILENDVLKLTISSDGNVAVKVKEIPPIKVKIEYKKVPNGLTVVATSNDSIFVTGDEEGAKGALIPAIFTKLFEKYNPIAFISTERISVLSMNNLISNYVYSPVVATQNKPLILDFMRWLYPIEEKFYGVKFSIDNGRLSAEIKGKKVPLSVISTGVAQLSVIEMLVENPILKTLIIEEPEINLHTDMQIEVGKYLSKVNKNMFITTHSEWFTVAFAYYLRNVKVYELRKKDNELFESKEIKVNEDGTLESLETIHKPEEEFLNKMVSEILSENDK